MIKNFNINKFYLVIVLFVVLPHCSLICQSCNVDSNNVIETLNNPNLIGVSNDVMSSEMPKIDAVDTIKDTTANRYIPLSEFMYANSRRYSMSGELPLKVTEIRPATTIAFGAGFAGIFVAQHIFQLRTLWDTLGPFKFAEDIKQDLWADKTGHFFDSYIASYLLRDMLIECGFNNDASTVWGGVLGLTYLNYIEVLDGFGKNWGFSPSDFYANVAGSLYFVGQHYFPYLQNFTPKFTYIPAKWHGEEPRMPHAVFIDDYSSHTTWLSVNLYNILPESVKDYWEPWLQISFGYAARNLFAYDAYQDTLLYKEELEKYKKITEVKRYEAWGSPRFIIALDYDLVKIFPEKGTFWNWLAQTLNHFKLPAPAVEFSYRKPRYYLVYPFSF